MYEYLPNDSLLCTRVADCIACHGCLEFAMRKLADACSRIIMKALDQMKHRYCHSGHHTVIEQSLQG